jgi:hypothetical protein
MEWIWINETDWPQRHFFHYKFHLTRPGSNPGRRGGKPATNRLSYGAAYWLKPAWFFLLRVSAVVDKMKVMKE